MRRWLPVLFVLIGLILILLISLPRSGSWLANQLSLAALPLDQIDYSVEVQDAEGRPLRLFTTNDGYWRLPLDLAQLDSGFVAQLLAYEDQRFYQHNGVDLLAMARAAAQWLWHGRIVSGGSTLSMQTVRLLQPAPRTLCNKLREMLLAWRLEQQLTKDQILGLYLELAPYGGNLQGVRAASRFYFGKEPGHLTLSQSALLIALPQSPEARRPDRQPEQARQARKQVLQRLTQRGLLSAELARLAEQQPIPLQRHATPLLAAHLSERLQRQQPTQAIIRSTINADLQQQLERLARQTQPQLPTGSTLAMMIVANQGRQVLAHIGSADYLKISQIDLSRAWRSPGSSLKPFIYGMGFETRRMHPQTRVIDQPGAVDDYDPVNFDGRYRGEISLRRALQLSLNTPAVAVLRQVGSQRLLQRFADVGVELRLPAHATPDLPIALGGVGTTLEQLITLYAGLADRGRVCPLNYHAETVDERCARLLEPVAWWYVHQTLLGMQAPDGQPQPGLAYKTGTSYGYRDAWALGYRKDVTLGVWVGQPEGGYGDASATGSQLAVPLLNQMLSLLPPAPPWSSSPPSGTLIAAHQDLPPALQWLDKQRHIGNRDRPRIRFPPDGADLAWSGLKPGKAERVEQVERAAIRLKVQGGTPPYRWLVNNRPLAHHPVEGDSLWYPQGPGQATITVLDSQGHSDRSQIWLFAE